MLAYIYRIIRDFEQQHGMHPNLLYLNSFHNEHLQAAFAENFTTQNIREVLKLDMVIDQGVMHPHVAWAQSAQKKIAS